MSACLRSLHKLDRLFPPSSSYPEIAVKRQEPTLIAVVPQSLTVFRKPPLLTHPLSAWMGPEVRGSKRQIRNTMSSERFEIGRWITVGEVHMHGLEHALLVHSTRTLTCSKPASSSSVPSRNRGGTRIVKGLPFVSPPCIATGGAYSTLFERHCGRRACSAYPSGRRAAP